MSRVIVIGGHGRTGIKIVDQLAQAGDHVVAVIRNPKQAADIAKLGAEASVLDLATSSGPDFQRVFRGADAVVFAAGSAEGEGSALDRIGTVKTVRAAERAGVKRYLTISSIGASTGMRLAGDWATDEMRDYYRQKRAANAYIRKSSLDWTILEPGGLTDEAGTGKVTLSTSAIPEGGIARADVAAVMVAALHNPKAIGATFQIVGGEAPIDKAIRAAVGG